MAPSHFLYTFYIERIQQILQQIVLPLQTIVQSVVVSHECSVHKIGTSLCDNFTKSATYISQRLYTGFPVTWQLTLTTAVL